jgi:hypothetical protein
MDNGEELINLQFHRRILCPAEHLSQELLGTMEFDVFSHSYLLFAFTDKTHWRYVLGGAMGFSQASCVDSKAVQQPTCVCH